VLALIGRFRRIDAAMRDLPVCEALATGSAERVSFGMNMRRRR